MYNIGFLAKGKEAVQRRGSYIGAAIFGARVGKGRVNLVTGPTRPCHRHKCGELAMDASSLTTV